MRKQLRYATFKDVGNREINEDSLWVGEKQNGASCFVLCDGLGGHGMGDKASKLVTEVFEYQFYQTAQADKFLGPTFDAAQEILLTAQRAAHAEKKMKSTVTALISDGKKAYIGHIGDSRVYVFSHNQVRCRTLDHSVPQMLALVGDIQEKEIRYHSERSILLRVMGINWEEPQYELMKPIPLRKCQAFLLCSDGFWELIEEKDMCAMLASSSSPQEWLSKMIQSVKTRGVGLNMDNFSAIAVWCD